MSNPSKCFRFLSFSSLMSISSLLTACNFSQVESASQQAANASSADSSIVPKEPALVDLIFVVDSANFNSSSQSQIQNAIQTVLNGYSTGNVNYQAAILNANMIGRDTGLSQLPQFSSLLPLLTGGNSSGAQLSHILSGMNFGLSNGAMSLGQNPQFQQMFQQLLPILMNASQQGSQGASSQQILSVLQPMITSALSQYSSNGGNASQLYSLIESIVGQAASGGAQNLNYQQILSTLLPMGLSAASSGASSHPYANLLMPVVSSLLMSQQSGKSVEMSQVLNTVLPIVLSQLNQNSSSGSSTQNQLIQSVLPLLLSSVTASSSHSVNGTQLLNTILPVVMTSLSANGANNPQAQLALAALPLITQFMNASNPSYFNNSSNNPLTLISSPQLMALVQSLNTSSSSGSFLRPEALLNIVMIGNSGAQNFQGIDINILTSTLLQTLTQIKGGQSSQVVLSALQGNANGSCANTSAQSLFSSIAYQAGAPSIGLCQASELVSQIFNRMKK